MGVFHSFKVINNSDDSKDELHIKVARNKYDITAHLTAFRFIDLDTKQYIFYLPSFNISGYGETIELATEMARITLDDLFNGFSTLSRKEITMELSAMGWKKGLFNKDFSKTYVNALGELKNFNVEIDKVERVTLTAA